MIIKSLPTPWTGALIPAWNSVDVHVVWYHAPIGDSHLTEQGPGRKVKGHASLSNQTPSAKLAVVKRDSATREYIECVCLLFINFLQFDSGGI